MKIYYSNLCKIGSNLSESLDELIQYGANSVELMLDGSFWNEFENHSPELAKVLAAKPLTYSVHTPVWDMNLTSENAQARRAALEAYEHSIAFAALIGAAHVVLHPGFCYAPVFNKSTARQRAMLAVEKLCEFDLDYGVLLLVENVGNSQTSIFSQDEYICFIQRFGEKIGSLLDIGHAHLCGWNLPGAISELGKSLYAVHLHDNNGESDSHFPIGSGNIQWNCVFEALRKCRPDLRLILEYDIGTQLKMLQSGKEILMHAFPSA